jgi:tripartite-type tricarboxylate transporter receptor subunit TctC
MKHVPGLLLSLGIAWAPGMLQAQDAWPTRPITFIVPYGAGGYTDLVARLTGRYVEKALGKPVIVDNRAGAGGFVGTQAVVNAAADGYTFCVCSIGAISIAPFDPNQKVGYDPLRDLAPVGVVSSIAQVVIVNQGLSVKTLAELVSYAKANPNKLNYASQGIGTAAHLIAELFKSMAGVQINHIPYRGGGPAVNDLVAGHVDLMFGELASAYQYIQPGQLRALAVSGDKRIANLPDVPTVSEVLPGFVVTSWWAIMAPPGMPGELTNKISAAVGDVMRQPDVTKRLTEMSMVSTGSTPAELSKFIAEEAERWGKVIRTTGAKPQ